MSCAMKNSAVYKLEITNSAYNVVKKSVSLLHTMENCEEYEDAKNLECSLKYTHMKWNIPATEENKTGCLWFHYRQVLLSSVRGTDGDAMC